MECAILRLGSARLSLRSSLAGNIESVAKPILESPVQFGFIPFHLDNLRRVGITSMAFEKSWESCFCWFAVVIDPTMSGQDKAADKIVAGRLKRAYLIGRCGDFGIFSVPMLKDLFGRNSDAAK